MLYRLILSLIFVFIAVTGFAKTQSPTADTNKAIKILEKYNTLKALQLKLEMTTEKKVLGTQTKDPGVLTYQAGKIHLLVDGEKKSEMIFNGKQGFLISYPDKDLDPDGHRKVFSFKSEKKDQLQILADLFSRPKKFFTNFKIEKASTSDQDFSLKLEDKNKNLKPMILGFSTKDDTLKSLSYADDVGSEIQIKFEAPTFLKSTEPNLFKYTPIKGDEEASQ